MAEVRFIDENIIVEAVEGTRLIDCIRMAGLKAETPCSCTGICGKCKVKAHGKLSSKSEEEEKHTKETDTRLACMAKVLGDVEVKLISAGENLKTIDRGYSIEVKADYAEKGTLGAAVDIGTTGISVYLVDLENGSVLDRISDLNPQTEYGGDVLSRITYAIKEENGLEVLSKCIRDKISNMLKKPAHKDYNLKDIYKVVISANTTMLHLFLGVSPESIAKAPYKAVFLDKKDFKAEELGIDMSNEGTITLLPSASAYVGSDILSGIVAVDFQNKIKPSLFIDIGTNGEIVVIKDGKMAASSTAAGPALEGMNISCGLRAEAGAIDSFNIDEQYNIAFTTIGDKEAKGICGSGLIDIAASLINRNIILKSGRFNKNLPKKLAFRLVDKKFYITEAIYISQNDIRQIQLAKAAIASGIIMLLKELNINIESMEEAVIAGAFGYHLNSESIKTIGLIPQGFKGEINFVGNSSVEGARLALINEQKLREMSKIKENMKLVELSVKQEFQDYFVKEISF